MLLKGRDGAGSSDVLDFWSAFKYAGQMNE